MKEGLTWLPLGSESLDVTMISVGCKLSVIFFVHLDTTVPLLSLPSSANRCVSFLGNIGSLLVIAELLVEDTPLVDCCFKWCPRNFPWNAVTATKKARMQKTENSILYSNVKFQLKHREQLSGLQLSI